MRSYLYGELWGARLRGIGDLSDLSAVDTCCRSKVARLDQSIVSDYRRSIFLESVSGNLGHLSSQMFSPNKGGRSDLLNSVSPTQVMLSRRSVLSLSLTRGAGPCLWYEGRSHPKRKMESP